MRPVVVVTGRQGERRGFGLEQRLRFGKEAHRGLPRLARRGQGPHVSQPDREGGALRYRGVDIEELVGVYRFEQVWGLLVDEAFEPGLPAVDPYEGGGLTGNTPSDLQSITARVGAEWGLKKLIDISDDEAREDIELVRVQDVDHTQSLGERMTNIGDVIIRSHDPSNPEVILRNVTDPQGVHEILRRAVLEARRRYGMSYREEM